MEENQKTTRRRVHVKLKKSRFKTNLLLAAALTSVVLATGIFFVLQNPDYSKQFGNFLNFGNLLPKQASGNIVTPTPIPQIRLDSYLVPVISLRELRNDISLKDLSGSKLCAFEAARELVSTVLPLATNITYIPEAKLAETLNSGSICLLPPGRVNDTMKTLRLDGEYFWAKEFVTDNYPFYSTKMVDETAETLALTDNTVKTLAKDDRFRLFVSGEIIPSRAVDRLALNKNNNYTYLFDYFRKDTESADLALALLENPLQGNPNPCTGCMMFVGDEKAAAGLATVGYDMLSTAGNHAGDGDQSAYKRTVEVLKDAGLQSTGTGNSDDMKIKPAISVVNGKRIGMIAADTVSSYYWLKGSNAWGANWFSNNMNGNIDWNRVKKVAQIKADNQIDYLIVYMSWGIEYKNNPIDFQKDLAHGLIDNGADLIVSSHPHWTQSMEFYKGKPIFYALGNYIFDQNHTDATRQGVNLNLFYVAGELKGIEIMPHLSCGPYITNNDLTNKYLKGEIDRNYLNSHDEKQGCVYFQAKKLTPDNGRYGEVYRRMMQYTNITIN